jgi:hypothetical protein
MRKMRAIAVIAVAAPSFAACNTGGEGENTHPPDCVKTISDTFFYVTNYNVFNNLYIFSYKNSQKNSYFRLLTQSPPQHPQEFIR